MKKYRFLILCLLMAVLIGAGAYQKRTTLKDYRMDPLYLYTITYDVLVEDVMDCQLPALQEGIAPHLEDETVMGTITSVESQPAASGRDGYYDVKLTLSGVGGKTTDGAGLEYDLTENNIIHFFSRYINFDGKVTHVREVKR